MSWWWLLSIIPVLLLIQNLRQPKLGVNSGQFTALGPKPNAVSSQATDERKRVAALDCSNVDAPIDVAARVLSEMPGAKLVKQEHSYLYAVFKTPLMRFRDDVELFFDAAEQRLHFRSASRAGYSDMGVNRKRYLQFARAFEKQTSV